MLGQGDGVAHRVRNRSGPYPEKRRRRREAGG
jgi:hypothetical protein